MASFEERVKAAAHYNSLSGHGGGARHMETARGALYGADAAEPEIGAVRRWLAGEVVATETLPVQLREVLRERDEVIAKYGRLHRQLESVMTDADKIKEQYVNLADELSSERSKQRTYSSELLRVSKELDEAKKQLHNAQAERDRLLHVDNSWRDEVRAIDRRLALCTLASGVLANPCVDVKDDGIWSSATAAEVAKKTLEEIEKIT